VSKKKFEIQTSDHYLELGGGYKTIFVLTAHDIKKVGYLS